MESAGAQAERKRGVVIRSLQVSGDMERMAAGPLRFYVLFSGPKGKLADPWRILKVLCFFKLSSFQVGLL